LRIDALKAVRVSAPALALKIKKAHMSQRYYSNIYWHFTGSPKGVDWSIARCPKDITSQGAILSDAEAAETLKLILKSKYLRATCTEKITEGMVTEKFCCVTDIPIKDLSSHAPYYGKVAIGFKAEVIHKNFVPVLYLPTQNLPAIEELIPNRELAKMASDLLVSTGGWAEKQGTHLMAQAAINPESVQAIDLEAIRGFFTNYVKITDFDPDSVNTYYREREWRCIGNFNFDLLDVEAVVAPADQLESIRECLTGLNATQVNILSWEFIERA
jgi:hypothetical protein